MLEELYRQLLLAEAVQMRLLKSRNKRERIAALRQVNLIVDVNRLRREKKVRHAKARGNR